MLYRILAETVLVLHFCFVIFVIFGGLLVLYRRSIAWLHVPAVVWGVLIEFFWWDCPLTSIENTLRERSGAAGYETGFIDYFVSLILYAPLSVTMRLILGLLLLGFNLAIYFFVFRCYISFKKAA